MKIQSVIAILFISVLFGVSCSPKVDESQLFPKNGIKYIADSDEGFKVFTGVAVSKYENGG